MSDILKKPYEISIWKDVLQFHIKYQESGDEEDVTALPSGGGYVVLYQYYKEVKIAVIGTETMTASNRVLNPVLTKNLNGTSSLNFDIAYRYFDDDSGEFIDNPIIGLLTNESKIKLKYGNSNNYEWYDFIIKNIEENSSEYLFSYECTDLFINELSKNGFSLEFNTDLENNQGTITELAEKVLEETDWTVDKVNSDTIIQKLEEALYWGTVSVKEGITGFNIQDSSDTIFVPYEAKILIFYSCLSNDTSLLQFLYNSEGYEKDSDRIITNSPNYCYVLSGTTYDTSKTPHVPNICSDVTFCSEYRGERIVRHQLGLTDPYTDKVVSVYYKSNDAEKKKYYGFSESEYLTSTSVTNLITNGSNYTASTGWLKSSKTELEPAIFPEVTSENFTTYKKKEGVTAANFDSLRSSLYIKNSDGTYESVSSTAVYSSTTTYYYRYWDQIDTYLRVKCNYDSGWFMNTGVKDNLTALGELVEGEQYCLRFKYLLKSGNSLIEPSYDTIIARLRFYTLSSDGDYDFPSNIKIKGSDGTAVPLEFLSFNKINGYYECIAKCTRSVSYNDLYTTTRKFGIVFKSNNINDEYYFQDVQLFKVKYNTDNTMIYPGDVPSAEIKTIYSFYEPSTKYTEEADIPYIYRGYSSTGDTNLFTPYYSEDNSKVTSITVSESNRFNIIQELCETFECWADFQIDHNEDGSIVTTSEKYLRPLTSTEVKAGPSSLIDYYTYDSSKKVYVEAKDLKTFETGVTYYRYESLPRQSKRVVFKEFIGKDNYAGFKYGINLSSITRTINSDQLVTKLIVKANSNEYAEDGFCDIQRASENPIGTSFIINLDYYTNKGLIDRDMLEADLYYDDNNAAGFIGYYNKLKDANDKLNEIITQASEISTTIDNLTASSKAYQAAADSASELINDKKNLLYTKASVTYDQIMDETYLNPVAREDLLVTDEVKSIITEIATWQASYKVSSSLAERDTAALESYEEQYDALVAEQETRVAEKEQADKEFYHKYSRFIQEGSWTDDSYIDDNSYYFDAQSVLYTSSRPEVQYTINVLEISELEDYQNYNFEIGDKTYIEDTEFFGWTTSNGIKTPYKEEIVISEIKNYLDDPSENTITVQNYKTQFEDLFQRITATTQSLQYSSGAYERAASVVSTDGTIVQSALANTLSSNSLVFKNATDQSVVIDSNGVTITNVNNPSEVVRLASGGIILSTDGGVHWTAGVTASGINASYLSGKITTTNVTIATSDGKPSIMWDAQGLEAFKQVYSLDDEGNIIYDSYGDPVVDYLDYSTFIRLDQFGLYGIKDYHAAEYGSSFVPKEVSDIEDSAVFGITWDGFFLKSDHTNGMVKISSEDDIQVFSSDEDGNYIERIKIGKLSVIGEDDVYGIDIKDINEDTVLRSDSDGLLFLTKYLRIGPEVNDSYRDRVKLGTIKEYIYDSEGNLVEKDSSSTESTILTKVFSVKGKELTQELPALENNENLAIYDNGALYATNAKISGRINATSGTFENVEITGNSTIGGLSIDTITDASSQFAEEFGVNGYLALAMDGIHQGVANNTLDFSKDGLSLNTYDDIEVTAETFDDLKDSLYIVNNEGHYEKLDESATFQEGQIYYTATKVFYVDSNGQLQITGNLQAASGTFTGTINASSGNIGGITINNGSLSAGGDEGFVINSDGSIIANNITLGDKITLTNGLEFTKDGKWTAGIYNPNNTDGEYFLRIYDDESNKRTIGIYADGRIIAGDIYMNGKTSTIQTLDYMNTGGGSLGWSLSPTEAVFNNITARGTLSAATFSYQEIQAVGGAMLIRPSSTITAARIEDDKIYLQVKDFELFRSVSKNNDTYAILGIKNFSTVKFTYIPDTDNNELILIPLIEGSISRITIDDLLGSPFISLGTKNSTGIGLNSETNGALLQGQSVSVFSAEEVKSNEQIIDVQLIPQVILGSIPNDNDKYGPQLAGKYGLYASNVYVHGSIVAKNTSQDDNNCAGLNTETSVQWPDEAESEKWFPDAQTGSIILWAGSKSEDVDDIKYANFKVDTYGNMYANSGYFEGTIITNATITASELKTALITGIGNIGEDDTTPALEIKDAALGIDFKGILNDTEQSLFSVSQNGVMINTIPLDAQYIFLHRPTNSNHKSIFMQDNEISIVKDEEFISPDSLSRLSSIYYSVDWTNDDIEYGSLKIGSSSKNINQQFSFGALPNSKQRDKDITASRENKSYLRFNVDNEFVLGEVSTDSTSNDYGREVMLYQKAMNSNDEIEGYNLFILKE